MSDSGSTQFPAGPKPLPSQTPRTASGEISNARVTSLPMELRDLRHSVRLRAEVVRVSRDARTQETIVQLRTERGDIEVRIPKDQPTPRQGQAVEIEIPASAAPGQPPERITLRPAPATPEEPKPARPIATPVDVIVRPPAERLDAPAERPQAGEVLPLPEPGALARLQPLPPQEVAFLQAQALPELILNTITEPVDFKAQIIVLEARGAILKETLNVKVQAFAIPQEIKISLHPAPTPPAAQAILNFFSAPQPQIPPPVSVILAPVITQTIPDQILTPAALAAPVPLILPAPAAGIVAQTAPAPNIAEAPQPPQQALNVRIESVIAPQLELVAPAGKLLAAALPENLTLQNQKPESLAGVAIGKTSLNLPVLNVFLPQIGVGQNFILQALPENLTPGTIFQITPQAGQPLPAQIGGFIPPLPPPASFMTPAPWPALDDIYQTLAATAPAIAQALGNIAPAPANAAQFSPAALFFIAAVRGGDITGWLGDKAIDILRREGRGNLVTRLSQEGGLLNRIGAEPISQDWRGVSLPLFWQGEFQKISLYFKQDSQNDTPDNPKGGQTRFIFDLKLSQMGKVQVDGLMRGPRLDVIVRTERTFSQSMQMDMRATYASALRETEFTGELSFQNHPDHWVTIKAQHENFGAEA